MADILNPKLHEEVKQIYGELVAAFASEDVHSEKFLSSFPYNFVCYADDRSKQKRFAEAALLPEFRAEAEKTIGACYANCSGGDLEFYIGLAVDDFLNYIIPRTIGLENGTAVFDRCYRQFDLSMFGNAYPVTVNAIVHDIYDHRGASDYLPIGFRLTWLLKGPGRLDVQYTRERAVPFFETRKAARPIGRGRELADKNAFYILEYSTSVPKRPDIVGRVSQLAYDIVGQFLFAARIKTYSTAYSDYRGFRMLGHLAPFSMVLLNYPDEEVVGGESRELHEGDAMAMGRLLTKLSGQRPSKFAVINQKMEDAMRRRRTAFINDARARKLNEIDQLLDYFQILEAVVPAEGSQYISLYAARLLSRANDQPNQAFELFKFIKDMHTVRNHVMHGRIDEVISGKVKEAGRLDIAKLRHVVYSLTCLYIMNGNLREPATRLVLGEKVELEQEYEPNPDQVMMRRMRDARRTPFW